jgi:hypothetical protein
MKDILVSGSVKYIEYNIESMGTLHPHAVGT